MAHEQITYNGSSSYDSYGYVMTEHEANPPARRTAFVDIPFGSGSYDFSDVYGTRYDMRELSITFERVYESLAASVAGIRAFEQWLMSISAAEVEDDAMASDLVGATVDSVEHSIEGGRHAIVTAHIVAQPLLKDGSI